MRRPGSLPPGATWSKKLRRTMSAGWRWAAVISRTSECTDGSPRALRSALTMQRTALRASVRDSDVTEVSALAQVVADAVEVAKPERTQTTRRAFRIWTPSAHGYEASRNGSSAWTKGPIEQAFALSSGVRRVQQHQAVAVPVALDGGHQAVPGEVRVARLDADRPRIAEPQQRVVVVEPDLAALDRQGLDRAAAP